MTAQVLIFTLGFLLVYGGMFYLLGRQHSLQLIDELLEEKIKEILGENSEKWR